MKWENMALKCFIKRYRDTMMVFILFIINLKLITLTKKNYDNTNFIEIYSQNDSMTYFIQYFSRKPKREKRC